MCIKNVHKKFFLCNTQKNFYVFSTIFGHTQKKIFVYKSLVETLQSFIFFPKPHSYTKKILCMKFIHKKNFVYEKYIDIL